MGSSGKPQAPNFSVFDNYIQEPAYLTGMIAGGMTKSNKIGMVGGYPIPEVNRLMHAFMAGAKEVNPKVEFLRHLHRLVVRSAQGQGSGLRDDREGRGRHVRRALRRLRRRQGAGKLAIGNVIDTQAQYPDTVVACRRCGTWSRRSTRRSKAVKAGKFKAEDYGQYSTMKHKGSELSKLGTFEAKVPKDLQAKVARQAEGHPRRQVQGAGGRDGAEVDGEVGACVATAPRPDRGVFVPAPVR